MPKTDTAPDLLLVAIQDLHHGAEMFAKALPKLATSVQDQALATFLAEAAEQSEVQAARLAATGLDTDRPPNVWMKGIIRDARRDSRSVEKGRLLDVALIGAVRKGLAAEIVSYETANALARVVGQDTTLDATERNLAERRAADLRFRTLLERISGCPAT